MLSQNLFAQCSSPSFWRWVPYVYLFSIFYVKSVEIMVSTSTKTADGFSCRCERLFPVCQPPWGSMRWIHEGAGRTHPHTETHGWHESANKWDAGLRGRNVNRWIRSLKAAVRHSKNVNRRKQNKLEASLSVFPDVTAGDKEKHVLCLVYSWVCNF